MTEKKPCAGKNCGTTTAQHSEECIVEYRAAAGITACATERTESSMTEKQKQAEREAFEGAARSVGAIVHRDGNIFFTNYEQALSAAILAQQAAAPAPDAKSNIEQLQQRIKDLESDRDNWRDYVESGRAIDAQQPAKSAVPAGEREVGGWSPITAPGQVSVRDYLRFTIGDKTYCERVKDVLDAGTDREEIIYNMRRNFYLITSMAMQNTGSQKNVEFFRATNDTGASHG